MKTHLDIDRDYAESSWPNLELNNHHETSGKCKKYNCHAWVLGIDNDRWAPYTYHSWFPGFEKLSGFPGDDIEIFKSGFRSIGFEDCPGGNLEKGFEKIAFYIKNKSVEHTAKQLENGHWTSKLGKEYHDIEHYNLEALEGGLYGVAIVFMRRKKNKIQQAIEKVKNILK